MEKWLVKKKLNIEWVIVLKHMLALIILILGISEGIIFLQASMTTGIVKEALLIHLVFWVMLWALIMKYLDKENGIPYYLIFFLPGLGAMVVAVLYFSLNYFRQNSMVLDEYERYVNYEFFLEQHEKHDFEKEMKTMSFFDQMNLLDASTKKELIVEFGMSQYEERVKILKHGLTDADPEVQHYSATTLNMLENDYIEMINRYREEYNQHKDLDSLKKLIKVYESYLGSGILSGGVLQMFNDEYIEVLQKLYERKKGSEIINQLVKAYISSGDLAKAYAENNRLVQLEPDSLDGLLNQIRLAYESNVLPQVIEGVRNLALKKQELNPQEQQVVAFWLAKEEY